ncbi:MAG TPA: glycosyltransferase family 9 protein [Myxococcota bacterium]|nr:glycosyltransferase family 9 protein [Myxococcota bacterium]
MSERSTRQQLLRRIRRRLRRIVLRVLFVLAPRGDAPLPDIKSARRILVVLVNFRLGNTLLATPAVRALTESVNGPAIDFLGGPSAPAFLQGFGLHEVMGIDRHDLFAPHRLLRLVRRLRRARYDVAIHLGGASTSLGALLARLSGAPERVGAAGRGRNFFFTTALEAERYPHKVDQMLAFVRALGVEASGERCLMLAPHERERAAAFLRERCGAARPVAIFVGARGHKGKSWSLASFAAIAARVRAWGLPVLVVLGPEEESSLVAIRDALGEAVYVHGLGLREVAALVAECAAVVTPDSGPMHLAIAAGAPTVALFRKPNHVRWGPRPPRGEVVFDPRGEDSEHALGILARIVGRPA